MRAETHSSCVLSNIYFM